MEDQLKQIEEESELFGGLERNTEATSPFKSDAGSLTRDSELVNPLSLVGLAGSEYNKLKAPVK